MTLPEGVGIGLGLLAIVAPALWPTMSKAITYPVATIGFAVLGWSVILSLEEATGMKVQAGPLTMLICAAALATGAMFWQVQSSSKGPAQSNPAPQAGASVADEKTPPAKNSPNISAGRDINIGHIGDVINNEAAKTPQDYGVLKPRSETLLSAKQASRTVEFGNSGSSLTFVGKASEPMFNFFNESSLLIESIDGHLKVSSQFFDDTGNLAVELVQNEWKVAPPPKTWDRNYTDDALEVRNAKGAVILQVRMLPDRIQMQGEWWSSNGHGLQIAKFTDASTGETSGAFAPLTRADRRNYIKIEPIFKYPSALHFGELR